jgi:hypothetical protein
MTTIKTLLAAALVAGSAGVAFASDNGDGARTLAEIRAVQQNSAPAVTEGRNAAEPGKFHYGDANVFRPQVLRQGQIEGRNSAGLATLDQGLEYRGSAN